MKPSTDTKEYVLYFVTHENMTQGFDYFEIYNNLEEAFESIKHKVENGKTNIYDPRPWGTNLDTINVYTFDKKDLITTNGSGGLDIKNILDFNREFNKIKKLQQRSNANEFPDNKFIYVMEEISLHHNIPSSITMSMDVKTLIKHFYKSLIADYKVSKKSIMTNLLYSIYPYIPSVQANKFVIIPKSFDGKTLVVETKELPFFSRDDEKQLDLLLEILVSTFNKHKNEVLILGL